MLKQATHIILATWLALSSSGFVLQKHFCMGELQDVALYQSAKACAGQEPLRQLSNSRADNHFSRKSCCKDTLELFQLEPDFLSPHAHSWLPDAELALPPIAMVFSEQAGVFFTPSLPTYRPPPLYPDIIVQVQNFRC